MNFVQRILAERHVAAGALPKPMLLLSKNHKTSHSINLPLINCRPTKRCSDACYACVGPLAWPNSIRKALVIDAMLREGRIEGLVFECRDLQNVRLNGSGDLRPIHIPAILKLTESCSRTIFWGFTRNREVAEALNRKRENLSLIVTFDATSPKGELEDYCGSLAFGPRRPKDPVPKDSRILVVFPEHHLGHTIPGVPSHPKDCPATRGAPRLHACQKCRRCMNPFESLSTPS